MKLFKCDICGKELKPQFYDPIYSALIVKENNSHEVDSYDMCEECKTEVLHCIEDLKMEKSGEFQRTKTKVD